MGTSKVILVFRCGWPIGRYCIAVCLTVGVKMVWIALLSAYLLAGFPFGWTALREYRFETLHRVPVLGILFYLVLRFVCAFFIGAVTLPNALYRARIDWS